MLSYATAVLPVGPNVSMICKYLFPSLGVFYVKYLCIYIKVFYQSIWVLLCNPCLCYLLFHWHICYRESKVLTRVLQSCVLNGFIFLCSILVFEYALLPAVKYLVTVVFGHNPGVAHNVWGWMQPFLSMTFRMIWVLPLFLLSKLVNSLWFQVSILFLNVTVWSLRRNISRTPNFLYIHTMDSYIDKQSYL